MVASFFKRFSVVVAVAALLAVLVIFSAFVAGRQIAFADGEGHDRIELANHGQRVYPMPLEASDFHEEIRGNYVFVFTAHGETRELRIAFVNPSYENGSSNSLKWEWDGPALVASAANDHFEGFSSRAISNSGVRHCVRYKLGDGAELDRAVSDCAGTTNFHYRGRVGAWVDHHRNHVRRYESTVKAAQTYERLYGPVSDFIDGLTSDDHDYVVVSDLMLQLKGMGMTGDTACCSGPAYLEAKIRAIIE